VEVIPFHMGVLKSAKVPRLKLSFLEFLPTELNHFSLNVNCPFVYRDFKLQSIRTSRSRILSFFRCSDKPAPTGGSDQSIHEDL
jgi:hypothetical protein